jgi:NAD(P)-dependent dehydrogenase (short-subunit alcohol dehydrogenase family)
MSRFQPDPTWLDSLNGRVVVLTGGASGIGAATVKLLHSKGAKVIFGDVNERGAEEVIKATSSATVQFLKCDASKYSDNLALFKTALHQYGHVDHAVANAGLIEQGYWFHPKDGLDGVEEEPSVAVLDVNLKGVLFFARIACAYLAHGQHSEAPMDKSLTVLASVAGFKESPGIPVYQACKHGVLGLMRSLRLFAPAAYPGLRINAVCPSMTLTRMVAGIKDSWMASGAPVNQPNDIANVIVGIAASGPGRQAIKYDESQSRARAMGRHAGGMDWDDQSHGLHGRAIYVAGGEGWDIEEGLDRTEHLWLGAEPSAAMAKAQRSLGGGGDWLGKE